ncbi:MAG: hypothetical protein PHY47_00570 [Lachnospiraceae bacterium]|nr:hypothetical protein [Lachnospiraceae bacterium]
MAKINPANSIKIRKALNGYSVVVRINENTSLSKKYLTLERAQEVHNKILPAIYDLFLLRSLLWRYGSLISSYKRLAHKDWSESIDKEIANIVRNCFYIYSDKE